MNGMESHEGLKAFVIPNTLAERGEFARVAETFSFDAGELMRVAKTNGRMVDLTSAIWNELDNTDSNRLDVGNWVPWRIMPGKLVATGRVLKVV